MSTIEHAQRQIDQLIGAVQSDLDRRGVLMLDHARTLITAVKAAQLNMACSERSTPADFFNAKWREQRDTLKQFETRLTRIINGTAIPMEDHERA